MLEATFDVSYNARPRVRSRLVLRFDELSVACRWQRAVQEATKDGAGWLKAWFYGLHSSFKAPFGADSMLKDLVLVLFRSF